MEFTAEYRMTSTSVKEHVFLCTICCCCTISCTLPPWISIKLLMHLNILCHHKNNTYIVLKYKIKSIHMSCASTNEPQSSVVNVSVHKNIVIKPSKHKIIPFLKNHWSQFVYTPIIPLNLSFIINNLNSINIIWINIKVCDLYTIASCNHKSTQILLFCFLHFALSFK